ncbi:MAG TPA: type II toxin-antitoxin system VapC family toxin [Candidatus Nitrosotalea sp.]|nr:type II toxin-antitoxin system VapC family toxin [Candidatus Nitrosotalea sp.]
MIYLDSAALVKLVRLEAATRELVGWLNQRPGIPLICSSLAEVEVTRAIRRVAPEALPAVSATLARLYRLEIDAPVRAAAAALAEPDLRTLDAIHIATAVSVGADLQAFVSYDQRLLRTAGELGLPVLSPGA